MPVCPECKGKKEFKNPSGSPLDVYRHECPTVYETYICRTCKGTGDVSALSFAIYKARGGPAPCPGPKGFA